MCILVQFSDGRLDKKSTCYPPMVTCSDPAGARDHNVCSNADHPWYACQLRAVNRGGGDLPRAPLCLDQLELVELELCELYLCSSFIRENE